MSNPILELAESLEAANRAYRDGAAILTDSEYDALERQLAEVAPNHALLTSLEDDSSIDGATEPHTIPMGSQLKALSVPELDPWVRRCSLKPADQIHMSYKLDGMSAEVTYINGALHRVLTRGDGTKGVNITSVAKEIPGLPKTVEIKDKLVVRGEIFMPTESLDLINQELAKSGKKEMANTRNGTVGIIKGAENHYLAKYLKFGAFDMALPE